MKRQNSENRTSRIFLGIDGGQSHTEAIVADENGRILGKGLGGASNHAEQPGGRERLQNAITKSVGAALEKAGLPPINKTVFAAAHCGMTGGADYKEEIIGATLKAEKLVVGHDAPTALFGATAGKPGIVVISGTGSVVYGENDAGEKARAGGLGFLFSDEGSGFWLAVQTIKSAIREQDGIISPCGLEKLVLEFFGVEKIRDLTTGFYNGKVSRDEIASFAKTAQTAAAEGNEIIVKIIKNGAQSLAENVAAAARTLNFQSKFPVAGVGGMFRASLMNDYFKASLAEKIPFAEFVLPRFDPAIGALLLSYVQAEIKITEDLLNNLENISN